SPVKVLVLDVVKPHKPHIVEFGKTLCEEHNIDSASITVYSSDEKTESLKMILEGVDLEFEHLKTIIEESGGVVSKIDKVVMGRKIRLDSFI
ncbi:MAG: DUF211 domain-containing protein, partial [Candidatus Altiarchaeota archaeon]|nr:DUF211 domain-containing protein [Candidatus Altiarchaeota archaeon]